MKFDSQKHSDIRQQSPEMAARFTELQLEFIADIWQHSQLKLPVLVNSFCPGIFGQPLLKAGLLLALLGGVPRFRQAAESGTAQSERGNALLRRGDIHVLL